MPRPACTLHMLPLLGMLATYNSVRDGTVNLIRAKLAANPGAALRVTGHSMGASMAELLCVDLQSHYGIECTQVDTILSPARCACSPFTSAANLQVYTFGTPRSGNQAFVQALAQAAPNGDMWRVTHWRDPVPHLPPASFGYTHATTEMFYNYDFTTSRQCAGGDDPKCCQQFSAAACLICCVMEHLSYLNETIGQAQCDPPP